MDFLSSSGAAPAICGEVGLPECTHAGTRWRLAQMLSELDAERSVLSGTNGHDSINPGLPQLRTEAQM